MMRRLWPFVVGSVALGLDAYVVAGLLPSRAGGAGAHGIQRQGLRGGGCGGDGGDLHEVLHGGPTEAADQARIAPEPEAALNAASEDEELLGNEGELDAGPGFQAELPGLGLDVRVGPDGNIEINRGRRPEGRPEPDPRRDEEPPEDELEEEGPPEGF